MTNVPETIRKRVDSLRATLEDHNYYYYVQDDPRIPDAEYDQLNFKYLAVLFVTNLRMMHLALLVMNLGMMYLALLVKMMYLVLTLVPSLVCLASCHPWRTAGGEGSILADAIPGP